MGRTCSPHGEIRNAYKFLVGKPERKTSLGRHKQRWNDNIKIDLLRIVCDGVHWVHMDQNRVQWLTLVKSAMNLRIPKRARKFLINRATVSFSRTLLHGVSTT